MLEGVLWPNGPVCPHCGNCDPARVGSVAPNLAKKVRVGLKQCKECRKQFTVTSNTVFASSKLPLSTWFYVVAAMCTSKKGVSAKQLQRELGSNNYEAVWFACHRVRVAMKDTNILNLLGGEGKVLEADETWVGGKPRFADATKNFFKSMPNKFPVMTLVERGGAARSTVMTKVDAFNLRNHLVKHGDTKSRLHTDEWNGYKWPGKLFAAHETVNHSRKEYARGDVFNNTAESYFSLLKRSVYGTHHHVSPQHLGLYLHEWDLKWSTRKASDVVRTLAVMKQAEGKRLMYRKPQGVIPGQDERLSDGQAEA